MSRARKIPKLPLPWTIERRAAQLAADYLDFSQAWFMFPAERWGWLNALESLPIFLHHPTYNFRYAAGWLAYHIALGEETGIHPAQAYQTRKLLATGT